MLGCARPVVTKSPDSFRETSVPALSDDLDLHGLQTAIEAEIPILRKTPSTIMQFGPVSVTRGEYAQALEELVTVLKSSQSRAEQLGYIGEHFRFFEFYGGARWGEVLLTSYFEPKIPGSNASTARFSQPLYATPHDLITIPLNAFSERFKEEKALKARIEQSKAVPYYTRADIDGKHALRGRNLELVWVDPVDAFFLQIQGSGTVELPDGSEAFITYADKNGHRYEPIGKYLRDRITPDKVTMQRVEAQLRSMNRAERDSYLFKNPSYVFFKRSQERAITSIGAPATPGRTIAADPRVAPKGALVFLSFSKPVFKDGQAEGDDPITHQPVSRLVLDQDSGGAITGTNRIDLFWGRGDAAKRYAGVIQDPARVLYLAPK
jgi:membrane-bound lytic murein transglycosylase A